MATTPTRTVGEDVQLVEEFLTAFVGGDADAIGTLVTEDCVLHQVRWPLDTVGREAIVEKTREMEAFVDVQMSTEEAVESGDRLAVYVTATGRNVGPVSAGDREIAPTGESFEIPQFGIYRVEDGQIAEAWILADALGLVEQLDNFPSGPGRMLRLLLRQIRWRLGGRRRLD